MLQIFCIVLLNYPYPNTLTLKLIRTLNEQKINITRCPKDRTYPKALHPLPKLTISSGSDVLLRQA